MPDLWSIALLLFLLCASACGGYALKTRLPERHRSRDSIELTQLGVTLLATFAAIVLGLLTTSVKAGFDAAYAARGTTPPSLPRWTSACATTVRRPRRSASSCRATSPRSSPAPGRTKPPADVRYPNTSEMPLTGESSVLGAIINSAGKEVLDLQPADAQHQRILNQCTQQYSDLIKSRWTVIEGARASISTPFYWVLVFWLVILFACLGLTAPPDAMAVIVIALSAISITGAVFVILDLDLPYGGLFGIPSESMRNALADMMR